MSVLNESQLCRDKELAKLIGMSLKKVQALPIATPKAIMISKGEKPKNLEDLYHDYKYLNWPAYLKTLMKTSIKSRHPELFKLLKETRNSVCLDFGSGVGTHAIALLENENYVSILDVPGKLFDFAKIRISNRRLQSLWYNNDEEIGRQNFDVIICTDVLEHCENPIYELERIRRALKSGGILHLQVSTMIKPSSGHFESSIAKWKRHGPKYLQIFFTQEGKTLWRKK